MIKWVFGVLFVVILSFTVSAQEIETSSDLDAGTTPDSIMWGIDRAIERIEIVMTFGSADKETKRLENAHERLLEVKKMIEENKLEDAERARQKHSEILEISRRKIAEISSDDDSDLSDIASLEDIVEAQEEEVDDLDISIRIKGTLSEEQKKLLQDFVSSFSGDLSDVKIVIKEKEDETITIIERRTGKTKIEIVDELGELREKKIVRAEVFDEYSVIKVGYRFTTRIIEREALINEIIEKFAVSDADVDSLLKIENADDNETDLDRLRIRIKIDEKDGSSVARVDIILRQNVDATARDALRFEVVRLTQLTKEQILDALTVQKEDDDNETEREIEIETKVKEDRVITKVDIDWDEKEKEIILYTADRAEIIRHLANLLGASAEDIEKAITKFETDDENDSDDVLSERKCLEIGGKWIRHQAGEWFCNKPTDDAGEDCTNNNQCESVCFAPEDSEPGQRNVVGKCFGYEVSVYECRKQVTEGVVDYVACA